MTRIVLPKSLSSIAQMSQLLDALPSVEKAGLTINGYPEFAFTVDTLPAPHRQALEDFAANIVASQTTNSPVRAVTIFGHADVPMRVKKEEQQQTALEVSADRADAAMEALKAEIKKRGGDKVLGRIHFRAKGVGSAFRKVIPALTDEDMKLNRRVEFFVASVILPPPAPKPLPAPAPREPGKKWTAQILNGSIASEGLTLVSVVTVTLTIEIVDVVRKTKGTFIVVAVGQGLPGASLGLLGANVTPTAALTQGAAVPFETLTATDVKLFAGRVAIFVDPGVSASVLSSDSFFRISFEGMEQNLSVFARPSVIPLPAGTRFDTAPQFGLGAVVHGPLIQKN